MRALLFALLAVISAHSALGATLHLIPRQTLSGKTVMGTPLNMTLTSNGDELIVEFTAPYYEHTSNNRVHLFLADANHRITEVEYTPSERILRMYWAPYNVLRTVAPGSGLFDASSEVNEAKKLWTGSGKVNKKLLPPRITLVNAVNVHPVSASDNELQYDSLYSITNSGIAIPDLMVLPRYQEIGPRYLFDNDSGYSEEWEHSPR